MGHLYPGNISEYLIFKLFRNWWDKDGCTSTPRDIPKPLIVKDVIEHFLKRIKRMRYAIDVVDKDVSKIFTEDIIMQEKTVKMLKNIMQKDFGVGCAEGGYMDEGMLDMAIYECLGTWESHGIVEEINKEWFFKKEFYNGNKRLNDIIIDEILNLLKSKKLDEIIVRYVYYALKRVGDIDDYVIKYIDM